MGRTAREIGTPILEKKSRRLPRGVEPVIAFTETRVARDSVTMSAETEFETNAKRKCNATTLESQTTSTRLAHSTPLNSMV